MLHTSTPRTAKYAFRTPYIYAPWEPFTLPAFYKCTCRRRSCSCCQLSRRLRSSLGSQTQWLTRLAKFNMGVSIYPDPTNNHAHIQTNRTEKRKGERTRETTVTNGDKGSGQDQIKEKKEKQNKKKEQTELRYLQSYWSPQVPLWDRQKNVFIAWIKCRLSYIVKFIIIIFFFFTSNSGGIFLRDVLALHWFLR